MQNIRHILVREFLERVRTKAFLITTLLTPLLMGLLIVLPMYLATRGANQKTRVIVAETGPKAGTVCALMRQRQSRTEKAAEAAPPMSNEKASARQQQSARQSLELTPAVVEPGHEAETRSRLEQEVVAGLVDAVLWIDGDPAGGGKVEYAARSVTDFMTIRAVQNLLSAAVVQRRLEARGLDAVEIESLVKPIEMTTLKISQSGSRQEDKGGAFVSSYIFVMLLYMTLLIWGITVMRGVIEEKSSRVFEVLLSVVKPFDLMAGKIFGIGAVGLVQYAIWILMLLVVGGGGLAAMHTQIGDVSVPGQTLFFLVLFFILGFFLYATMYAAVGAMVSSEQEAQQVQMVVMWGLILPIILMPMVIRAPGSTTSTVLSLIPLFTPILMLLRITLVTPPAWQIALSIVLLILTNIGVIWVAARIYRVGILMYGKRPNLPEIWRWVRAS